MLSCKVVDVFTCNQRVPNASIIAYEDCHQGLPSLLRTVVYWVETCGLEFLDKKGTTGSLMMTQTSVTGLHPAK